MKGEFEKTDNHIDPKQNKTMINESEEKGRW